jgi:hypothetical protein
MKPVEPGGHRSPGFSLIASHLRNDQKQDVLDLGAAVSANIEFLSALRCRLYVEPLAAVLGGLNAPRLEETSGASPRLDLLPFPADTQFDAILAWDLLNYLEVSAIETLIERLIRFCKPGTLLFAQICMGKQIPSTPMGIKILADDRLTYETAVDTPHRCPQYSSAVLLRKLPGFSVVRSYLLQNNIQEYVFRYQ